MKQSTSVQSRVLKPDLCAPRTATAQVHPLLGFRVAGCSLTGFAVMGCWWRNGSTGND